MTFLTDDGSLTELLLFDVWNEILEKKTQYVIYKKILLLKVP